MKSETSLNNNILIKHPEVSDGPRRSIRTVILNPLVCSVAASIGIFGGISSLVAGVMCVVIHSILQGDEMFNRVGTTLLILGIPMILLGSVFLDEIGPKK